MDTSKRNFQWRKITKTFGRVVFLCGLLFGVLWLYDAVANRRYLQREYVLLKSEYSVVAFGDSLTEGIGARDARGHVARLAERYSLDILNKGIRRHQSSHLLARVEMDVLAYKPKLVIMTVGGNDVLRGVPFATFSENLSQLFTIFQKNNIAVLYLGVKTSRFGDDNQAALQALCDSFPNVTYIPNILEGVLFNPLRLSDAIHPDDAGYELITDRIAPTFEKLLQLHEIPFTKKEENTLPPFDGPSLGEQLRTNVPVEFERSYNPLRIVR